MNAQQHSRVAKRKEFGVRHGRQLVQVAAAKLRDLVLERAPDTQIGSLSEVAELLGVGIVTVQQAARILEHEGLLAVRRGPRGGYYGTRPDEAALERSIAAYMREHNSSQWESLEIVSLLDCEMVPAAARCRDEALRDAMRALGVRIDACDTETLRIAFEGDFHDLLFKMDARPLFELILRVATQVYRSRQLPPLYAGEDGVAAWKSTKHKMLAAILAQDEALARFEAERNRREVLARLERLKREA